MDRAYSATLAATGSDEELEWAVARGTLPSGLNLSRTGAIAGTPTGPPGSSTVTFRVTSGGQQVTKDLEFRIVASSVQPLVITTQSLPRGVQGAGYGAALEATGGSGGYAWRVNGGALPPGVGLSSTGTLSGIPTSAGLFTFVVLVESGTKRAEKQFELAVDQVLSVSSASPLPNGIQNQPYNFTFQATGGTGSYSWSTVGGTLPTGVSLATNGVLSGTPTNSGTFNFTVQVVSGNQTATKAFQWPVNPPALAITSASPLPNGTQNQPYNFTFQATGGTGSYSWTTVSGTLPSGVSLGTNGALSGTPTVSGTFNFTVQVASGTQSVQKAFSWTVNPPPLQILPSQCLFPSPQVGVMYSCQLQATGGNGSYSWSLAGGALPPGLSLSPAGLISGTPTTSGQFAFVIRVSSGGQSTTVGISMAVTDPRLQIVSPSPLPSGAQNQPYSFTFQAIGGTGSYSWSTVGGTLPAGVSLATNGVLSGAPTSSGTFNFTVQVVSGSQTTTKAFQWTVVTGLTATVVIPIQNCSVGATCSFTPVTAAGGTPPYSFAATGGVLPAGMSFNTGTGAFTGTPTNTVNTSFTVTVTDAANATASQRFQLIVTLIVTPGPPITPTGLTATAVSSSQIDLSWNDVANETSYELEVQGGQWPSWVPLTQPPANTTRYPHQGLNAGTQYCYRISARNAAGVSTPSGQVCATTQGGPPVAPSGLTATAVSGSQIDLAWTDNATNETTVEVEQRSTGGTFVRIVTLGANSTGHSATGLTANTPYEYRVRACNSAGCSGYSNLVSAMTRSRYASCAGGGTLTTLNANFASSVPGAFSSGTNYCTSNGGAYLVQPWLLGYQGVRPMVAALMDQPVGFSLLSTADAVVGVGSLQGGWANKSGSYSSVMTSLGIVSPNGRLLLEDRLRSVASFELLASPCGDPLNIADGAVSTFQLGQSTSCDLGSGYYQHSLVFAADDSFGSLLGKITFDVTADFGIQACLYKSPNFTTAVVNCDTDTLGPFDPPGTKATVSITKNMNGLNSPRGLYVLMIRTWTTLVNPDPYNRYTGSYTVVVDRQ